MQNLCFDLKPGQSIRFGEYRVTLLEVENQAAVLEIDGPEGCVRIEPVCDASEREEELAVLA
ncbi:MAG: hypothetical protein KDA81_03430 [Planctomycetaceae bacterium]|nr:hypothetical protein [Planctomycetaceae bacterium]